MSPPPTFQLRSPTSVKSPGNTFLQSPEIVDKTTLDFMLQDVADQEDRKNRMGSYTLHS